MWSTRLRPSSRRGTLRRSTLDPPGTPRPHAPQLFGSLRRSTHCPLLHWRLGGTHCGRPATHLYPAGMAWPHARRSSPDRC